MVVASRPGALAIALLGLLSGACAGRVQDVDSRYLPRLEALEQRLGGAAPQSQRATSGFSPTGLYVEGDVVWVYSSEQPSQLGFRLDAERFIPAGVRSGPRETVGCVVGHGDFAGRTLCLGRSEPGGLKVVAGAPFLAALESRAGYRDLVQARADRLLVIDDVEQRLVSLGPDGSIAHISSVPSGSYRVGSLGQGRSFVLSATRPHVSTYSAAGVRLFASPRVAPLRNASFDRGSDLFWSVGPEDAVVRRYDGPIQHLSHELRVSRLNPNGALVPMQQLDLGKLGLTDPTSVAQNRGATAVTLAGSDRVLLYRARSRSPEVRAVLGSPWSVVAYRGGFVGVSRLDDRLWYLPATSGEKRVEIALSPPSAPSAESLGERLFYGSALWRQNSGSRAPYTCNSCHWETESDGRRHPGFLERRWEITRSLAGMGAVRPIFSTGGAKSLSRALEGLIRGLDERMWSEGATGYWDQPLSLETSAGSRRLSPLEVREALLTFVMSLPARPGPLAGADGAEWAPQRSRGAALFARDCAACHLPTASMRRPNEIVELGTWLERGGATRAPLSFGAAAFAETGSGASFTPNGNRISPLWGVGRRARLYVTGRARNLRQLVSELRPGSAAVHGGAGLTPYSPEEEAAIWVFLNSL
ncbi:MAG: hypothetical protein AB7K71_30830 [Polyangiaceae bacterium]